MSSISLDPESTSISYPEDDHLVISYDNMVFHLYYHTVSTNNFMIYFTFQNYQFTSKCISNTVIYETLPQSSTRLGLHDIITIFNTQIDYVQNNLYRLVLFQKMTNFTLKFDLNLVTPSVCMTLLNDLSAKINEKDAIIENMSRKIIELSGQNQSMTKKLKLLINEYNKWGEKMNAGTSTLKSEIAKFQKIQVDQSLALNELQSKVETATHNLEIQKTNSSIDQHTSIYHDLQITGQTFNLEINQYSKQLDLETVPHSKSHGISQSYSKSIKPSISPNHNSHNSVQYQYPNQFDWQTSDQNFNPQSGYFYKDLSSKMIPGKSAIFPNSQQQIKCDSEVPSPQKPNSNTNKKELDQLMSKLEINPEVQNALFLEKHKKSNFQLNKPLNYLNQDFASELNNVSIINQSNATLKCLIQLNEEEYAYGDWYGKIIILNKDTHKPSVNQFNKKDYHTNWVNSMIVVDKPNYMISGSSDNTLKVWNTETYKMERTLSGHTGWVISVAQINSLTIASGSIDKTIIIWNFHKGEAIACIRPHTDSVNGLANYNLDRLLSTSSDKTIRMWALGENPREVMRINESNEVFAIQLITKTAFVVTVKTGDINAWDIGSRALLYILKAHLGRVNSLIKLSNNLIASAGDDKIIYVWDLNNRKSLKCLKGHVSEIYSLLKLSDSEILSCGADMTLRLWK